MPKRKGGKQRRPGVATLREIQYYQTTVQLCIRQGPFQRLVREVAQDTKEDLRFTRDALKACQVASEDYLLEYFILANRAAIHAKRVTVLPKDWQFVKDFHNFQTYRVLRQIDNWKDA